MIWSITFKFRMILPVEPEPKTYKKHFYLALWLKKNTLKQNKTTEITLHHNKTPCLQLTRFNVKNQSFLRRVCF